MEATETMQLGDFEDLPTARAHDWEEQSRAGEKKLRICGSKSSEWIYTKPYR